MNLQQHFGKRSGPIHFTSIIVIFALIVQQAAFVSIPMVMSSQSLVANPADIENPFNTVAVALSLLFIGTACLFRIKRLAFIAMTNFFAMLFMCLVILSAFWSIHPDVTIRRGVGYLLTMLIAAYLPARYSFDDIMKLLSIGFSISAIGSILFAAIAPDYGVMQLSGLGTGNWRGVFAHKQQLGVVMSVAVFTELYILTSCVGQRRWRVGLLAIFSLLVLLSDSTTALLTSVGYLAGALVYLLWKRNKLISLVIFTILIVALLMVFLILLVDPDTAFNLLGKDATLTGRTAIWQFALELIAQKPVLGWGYRAVWQPNDAITVRVDEAVGWAVPHAHNTFLETTLQLGWVGLAVMVLMICVALWRCIRCCTNGITAIGWFSLMFFVGELFIGQTEITLGQNQSIEWVIFNVLLFSCGLSLVSIRASSWLRLSGWVRTA